MTHKKKAILYPVLFMMAITAGYTLLLALINEASIGRIQAQEALQQKQSILYVLGLEVPQDPDAANVAFNENIRAEKDYFVASAGQHTLGYAFPISGPGLWGTISGYAAISADGDRLLGVALTSHSETPGLGGRISEDWFKEQFRNIPVTTGSMFLVFRPAPEGNIDAITGATLTSEAVRKIILQNAASFKERLSGGQL